MILKKRTYFGKKSTLDLTDHEKSMIQAYKDRFSWWHNKQIDLLTFCINFVFTISIAISGFILNNHDKVIFKDKMICNNYSLIRTTLCILTFSITIGIIALITRLNDFRLTKNTIKARRRIYELNNEIKYEDTEPSDTNKQKSKKDNSICISKFLGKTTWILFYLQISLLLLTIWIIALSV